MPGAPDARRTWRRMYKQVCRLADLLFAPVRHCACIERHIGGDGACTVAGKISPSEERSSPASSRQNIGVSEKTQIFGVRDGGPYKRGTTPALFVISPSVSPDTEGKRSPSKEMPAPAPDRTNGTKGTGPQKGPARKNNENYCAQAPKQCCELFLYGI